MLIWFDVFVMIKKFKMSGLAYSMWMFGIVWCSNMWSRDHCLLSDHYIFFPV